MQFIQSDLGYRQKGEIVEVTLRGSAANVRLLDSANFSSYKNGRRHTYHGGLAKRSPVRLARALVCCGRYARSSRKYECLV